MSYWFLATPYSKYPHGLEAAFKLAVRCRAVFVRAGIPAFSPIAHSHPVATLCDLDPLDHNIWLPSERPFLDGAKGLVVVLAEGWRESIGMAHEIELFRAAGKTIVEMVPFGLPEGIT